MPDLPSPLDPSAFDALLLPPPPLDRPRLSGIQRGAVTRFAPAPTGALHLGHLVDALFVWGVARATGGRVVLRIEDHDRQRSRSTFERELLDDLDRLGLVPDQPSTDALRAGPSPFRQSDDPQPYEAALARLRGAGIAYGCTCTRSTFTEWAERSGRAWEGPGCPSGCRDRGLAETAGTVRLALGAGREGWLDLAAGPIEDDVIAGGDPVARDRRGNWTYGFSVVVDDLRHGIDLVIRGRDLLHATAGQIRLGRVLGRETPPRYLHHPLVRAADGRKLSKADGATSVRSLLDAGWSREALFGIAARMGGLQPTVDPLGIVDLPTLFDR